MKRMAIERKLVSLVEMLYKETFLKTEIEGIESEWLPQKTGIRQGCPLSPYMFLFIMTTLFHDTHRTLGNSLERQRVPGAEFDEVTYADDKICIATETKAMNELIKEIEKQGKDME